MDVKSYNLEDYKKYHLSKSTVTAQFSDLVEFCLISEDESAKHLFHKVQVPYWTAEPDQLFDTLSEAMSTSLVPIKVSYENDVVSFYTSNLNFIFRIMKSGFSFVYQNTTYYVDHIVFNSASSTYFFGRRYTLEEIVRNIVLLRFNAENNELDLSKFIEEQEFSCMEIYFYKIHLLAYYKELMLKMGREAEILNLSNNKLSTVPQEIMNFFIKGKLKALNVSNNCLTSLADVRATSLIEKLWLEGNPLCNTYNVEPYLYVKNTVVKFPRLQWLDDIPVNRSGLIFPFCRIYLSDYNEHTRDIVDKFLILYFSHYDSETRKDLNNFYHANCMLSISTGFTIEQESRMSHYIKCSRNMIRPTIHQKAYHGTNSVHGVLSNLPRTQHDPNSFTIDVIRSEPTNVTFIVDGVFKEFHRVTKEEKLIQFRRTFVLVPEYETSTTNGYYITNDMFSITFAGEELASSCFQTPVRNLNSLMLVNPSNCEIEAITAVLMHETNLKKSHAMELLRAHDWDLQKALLDFCVHLRLDHIPLPPQTPTGQTANSNNTIPDTMSVTVQCDKTSLDFSKISYDGKTCVRAFIQHVEEFMNARNISSQNILSFGTDIFKEGALHWFRSVREQVSSWQELSLRLKEDFSLVDNDYRLLSEIKARTQGERENITVYLLIMSGMFSQLNKPLSEAEKIEILLHNIRPCYAAVLASVPDISTIETIRTRCKNYENIQTLMSQFHEPPRVSTGTHSSRNSESLKENSAIQPTSAISQGKFCPRCRVDTHSLRSCKAERKIVCFRCGKPDFKYSNCPVCQKSSQSFTNSKN